MARSRSPRGRSSPGAAPFEPLRWDAPGRSARGRGQLPPLLTAESRAAALRALDVGVYAASSRRSHSAMWRTIVEALAKFSLPPFPPSKSTITSLGAALKAGSYASAGNYLSYYRASCEREGFVFDPLLARVQTETIRSCKRGLGAPTKALALPLMRLAELGSSAARPWADDAPWVPGGPVGSACAVVAGAWFLAREVELSTTRACLVSLEKSAAEEDIVRWYLPASKTDVEASGVSRAHGCCCVGGVMASCPYHAIQAQLQRLKRLFPGKWCQGVPSRDLPLFPASDGTVVSKDHMKDTIVEAARRLGVPLVALDGSARVSGHSLRATGAQGLARAGVDIWAIQLLGRWGSSTVLEYVREVPLEMSTSWAARAARACTLEEVLGARPSSSSSSSLGASVPAVVVDRSASSSSSIPRAGQHVVEAPIDIDDALRSAESAAVTRALPWSECSFVRSPPVCSTRVGKWHRVAPSGLSGVSSCWSSACGWRFAGTDASVASTVPDDLGPDQFCAKCFK